MSNYLTIAVITAAIREIVQEAAHEVFSHVNVTIGPPRALGSGEKEVNIYLYRISPNAELRGDDLPTRSGTGELIRRPVAAIRLHYLIAFADDDYHTTEIVLGKVISVLHAGPILTAERLRRIVGPNGRHSLKASDLLEQDERIKLTPEHFSLDELSKFWTGLLQLAHRPSLQYVASPVLIDADVLPVLAPHPHEIASGIDSDSDPQHREAWRYDKPKRDKTDGG